MKLHSLTMVLAGITACATARAQLAITEIQTQEATPNSLGKKGPDWWELSNYGSTNILLTGYLWSDGGHAVQVAAAPFTGVTIQPGETIIITETNSVVFSAATFRQWWGANVSPAVQIILSPSANGLSASGEALRLWSPAAASASDPNDPADLVDRVDVGAVPNPPGQTFIYHPANGTFDWLSTNAVGGAFTAATSADVGSPGAAPTAGPLTITRQPGPAHYTAPAGLPLSYTAAGYGLPKPKFTWLFNGAPLDPDALGASIANSITNNQSLSVLTIGNVQMTNAGTYTVVAYNGVQAINGSNAVLTVTTDPVAPLIDVFPQGITAYTNQTVTFIADAIGSPSPAYQWSHNGTALTGQTLNQLTLALADASFAGTYTVVMTNSVGQTNASAILTMTPKPNLRITEVMSDEAPGGGGHQDWWELSNLDSFPVSLLGYRFDDQSFLLTEAYTITNDATLAPGESIVLVEDMTADQFRAWWGPDQLPPKLQIITYHGGGLSLGSAGDAITLWNAAATSEADYIEQAGFSTAASGQSFGFDPGSGTFGQLSTNGVNGAFVAAVNGDIGSPGAIVNLPRFIGIAHSEAGSLLSWVSQPSRSYAVQFKSSLTEATWQTLTNALPAGDTNVLCLLDPSQQTQRFYRVILNP